jgi:hypothetical protein
MEQLSKEQHHRLKIHYQADQQVPIMYLAMAMEMAEAASSSLSLLSVPPPSKAASPHRSMPFKRVLKLELRLNGHP